MKEEYTLDWESDPEPGGEWVSQFTAPSERMPEGFCYVVDGYTTPLGVNYTSYLYGGHEKLHEFTNRAFLKEAFADCHKYENSKIIPDGYPSIDFLLEWLYKRKLRVKSEYSRDLVLVNLWRPGMKFGYDGDGDDYYEALRNAYLHSKSTSWGKGKISTDLEERD